MKEGKPCILVVDDMDSDTLEAGIAAAFGEPIEILMATDIAEARAILRREGDFIDVVVLDIFIPGDTPAGLDLGREVAGHIPLIFISGHPESHFRDKTEGLAPIAFHQKSPDLTGLIEKIRIALALREPAERLGPDMACLRSLGLCYVPGTAAAVRFLLRPLRPDEVLDCHECQWDFAPLAMGFRHLEVHVRAHEGRVLHLDGMTALAVFPGSGAAPDHFSQAMTALSETARAVDGLMTEPFYSARFAAGAVPGSLVMGVFGERNPGHSAVTGRPVDLARQLLLSAKPGEVGVLQGWLSAAEKKAFQAMTRSARTTSLSLQGVSGPVECTYGLLRAP